MTTATSPTIPVLDVRGLPCAERKAGIFGLFDEIAEGASFQFINDHDPAGLRGIFQQYAPEHFTWTYVTAGPQEWRIEIGRV